MPETKRPLKVFLCHASQDKPMVRELSQRLFAEGWIDPWLDEKKLLPGQDWRLKIEEAVETSDIVIICLSSNSVNKEGFVQKELRYAREIALEKLEESIFLIPLRFDDCSVPRGLRFYQWADYFGENRDETYSALIESLKLRYEQILKIEEELARREKERQERETAEKVARERAQLEAGEKLAREKAEHEKAEKVVREKAKREAVEKAEREKAEKATRDKLERDAAEKARREKAEREAVEKAAQEKTKRDSIGKAKREKTERQFARKAAFAKTLSQSFSTLKSTLPKILPFLGIAGFAGIALILFWFGSWAVPKFISFIPKAQASETQLPTVQITSTNSLVHPAITQKPNATPTKTITFTPTSLPTEITDAKDVPMMLVPAGEFIMGSNALSIESPVHNVFLDDFYIDKYEVTISRYKACENAGVCLRPLDTFSLMCSDASHCITGAPYYYLDKWSDYPVNNVNWTMAKVYCEWRGLHLPTEAQWEKAARGIDGRTYPWGEGIDCTQANYSLCSTENYGNTNLYQVGSLPAGVSHYGVYDLAGNVWEWVADWYGQDYYGNSSLRNPLGPDSGDYKIVRGGAALQPNDSLRSAYRKLKIPTSYDNFVGFRCVQAVTP